jgi:hypothetical protein
MRVFILSVIVLTIIIAFIVCDSIYMDNITNKMLDLISNLPENSNPQGDMEIIDELSALWKSNEVFVAINANNSYINDISAALIDVKKFYLSEYDTLYQRACEHLYQAVYRLHELERFSLDNII